MSQQILVVDDDPHIRSVILDVLADEGFVVASAADGRDALAQIAAAAPALVLLDLQMPVLSGWDVLRALRASQARVPVVLMSAGVRVREEAARLQAAGYLAKPFALDDLVAVVERYTRRP
jgi:two-component system response regulator PrrA